MFLFSQQYLPKVSKVDEEYINRMKSLSAFQIANQFDWEIHDYKNEEVISE